MTIGTAGHVDHGKTALVAALTGVDTDRLPEEKARGLSIALGYAPLRLPSGRRASLVDVPGHERFVRTMVAGATGVDAFLMTVAADDGVMPQTVEHAQVLSALGVGAGVVAVTKSDLADPARARRQAEELLPGCEAVACSVRSGAGIAELAAALERVLERVPSRAGAYAADAAGKARARSGLLQDGGARTQSDPGAGTATRLHIDRVFTVPGRSTVVTGTLWSGAIAVEDALQIVPGGAAAKVRGVEVHGEAVASAAAGQRVAVNLRGVKPGQVQRGDVLAAAGAVAERSVIDCALSLDLVRKGERVQVHHGTRHAAARLRELDGGVWRVRLERPLLVCDGDRIVVRRHAPPQTLGGGIVLDVSPGRRTTREGRRATGGKRASMADAPAAGSSRDARPAARARTGPASSLSDSTIQRVERLLREAGVALVSEAQIGQALGSAAQPGQAPGSSARRGSASAAALRALREDRRAVRVSGRLYAHCDAVADAERRIGELIERDGNVTLARARDALGVGRKAAQALLEHFDAKRLTRRLADDSRVWADGRGR